MSNLFATEQGHAPTGVGAADTLAYVRTEQRRAEVEQRRAQQRRTQQRRPKRVSRAQALVDFGLADSLADARAQLRDMGE